MCLDRARLLQRALYFGGAQPRSIGSGLAGASAASQSRRDMSPAALTPGRSREASELRSGPRRRGGAMQAKAEPDPAGTRHDQVDAEEQTEDVDAVDGPTREDQTAEQ